MTAKTRQYIFRFYELTAKKRMLCKMVAEVQSINDSATKGARCELSSLLYSICQNYNEQNTRPLKHNSQCYSFTVILTWLFL